MDDIDHDAAIVEHVSARAALAGNPSDGYGGAVLAIPVNAYAATVVLRPADHWSISDEHSGPRSFDGWDDLSAGVAAAEVDAPHALLLATIDCVAQRAQRRIPVCSIDVTTSIPLAVGLAGSSAIVIGVLRSLYRAITVPVPPPVDLARMALDVEVSRLGIAAGLQDRLVQSHGRPVLMRFDTADDVAAQLTSGGDQASTEMIEPGAKFRFMVAHRMALSEPSQLVHGDLRRRFDGGDQIVRGAMGELCAHAISARDAFVAGDAMRLGAAMDATFDVRAGMIDLVPGHVEMITAARAAGASANYTGSGGAVIVFSPNEEVAAAARQSLKRLGCEIVALVVSPDVSGPSGMRPSLPGFD